MLNSLALWEVEILVTGWNPIPSERKDADDENPLTPDA